MGKNRGDVGLGDSPRMDRLPLDRYTIRVAETAEELAGAFYLVQQAYAGRGITAPDAPEMRIAPQHVLRESIVLVAVYRGSVVGTITVFADTEAGLPLDKDYGGQLWALRRCGARLAEYGSFAIAPRHRGTGLMWMLSLGVQWVGRHVFRASHAVIGVHPSAATVYESFFAFTPLGPSRAHAELDAPVLGLVQETRQVASFVERSLPHPLPLGRTFVEHLCGELPACYQFPRALRPESGQRWQLPREAFRGVFIERSRRLLDLDAATRRVVRKQRSDETLAFRKSA